MSCETQTPANSNGNEQAEPSYTRQGIQPRLHQKFNAQVFKPQYINLHTYSLYKNCILTSPVLKKKTQSSEQYRNAHVQPKPCSHTIVQAAHFWNLTSLCPSAGVCEQVNQYRSGKPSSTTHPIVGWSQLPGACAGKYPLHYSIGQQSGNWRFLLSKLEWCQLHRRSLLQLSELLMLTLRISLEVTLLAASKEQIINLIF